MYRMNLNMELNFSGVFLLLLFMVLVEVRTQGICNRTESTGKEKLVRKWKFVYGRRKTFMDFEPITTTVLECCKGYMRKEVNATSLSSTELPPICIPQCEPPCTNGACLEPNICKCVSGYELKNGTCQPVCSEPCYNGTCIEPETCKCHTGYRMSDVNVCTPVCSMGCGNGSCISPEVCLCKYGFTFTNGSCEPKCWPPCETGECIAPDTCSCGPGYESIMTNVTSCEPICSPECENGVCVGPNICICDKGYKWQNKTCQPVCSSPCFDGTCVAPDTCECFEGYKKYFRNVCVPSCTNGCGLGRCISPEVCQCYEGFSLNNGTCEPVCSPPCVNGVCTHLSDCECNSGYVLVKGICEPESKLANTHKLDTFITVTYANDEHEVGTTWTDNFSISSYSPIEGTHKSSVSWMYYVIPILVLLIIVIIMILIWKRNVMLTYCAGRTYVVSDDHKHTARKNNIPDVTFSAIEERQAKRE